MTAQHRQARRPAGRPPTEQVSPQQLAEDFGSAQPDPAAPGTMWLRTVGHGTATAERLAELLCGAGVERLVDVRTAPGSRRNPEMSRAEMSRWLPERGIAYSWDKRLGGWRKIPEHSPDTGLRHASFAGYAAHMRTGEFAEAIDELLTCVASGPTAVLCAESVWWRCHRRMIADFVELAREVPTWHLMHEGRPQRHRPTDVVRLREDGLLVYDGGQQPLLG